MCGKWAEKKSPFLVQYLLCVRYSPAMLKTKNKNGDQTSIVCWDFQRCLEIKPGVSNFT